MGVDLHHGMSQDVSCRGEFLDTQFPDAAGPIMALTSNRANPTGDSKRRSGNVSAASQHEATTDASWQPPLIDGHPCRIALEWLTTGEMVAFDPDYEPGRATRRPDLSRTAAPTNRC